MQSHEADEDGDMNEGAKVQTGLYDICSSFHGS